MWTQSDLRQNFIYRLLMSPSPKSDGLYIRDVVGHEVCDSVGQSVFNGTIKRVFRFFELKCVKDRLDSCRIQPAYHHHEHTNLLQQLSYSLSLTRKKWSASPSAEVLLHWKMYKFLWPNQFMTAVWILWAHKEWDNGRLSARMQHDIVSYCVLLPSGLHVVLNRWSGDSYNHT